MDSFDADDEITAVAASNFQKIIVRILQIVLSFTYFSYTVIGGWNQEWHLIFG